MTWPGDPRTETVLERSIASLKEVHPELPYHVERMPQGTGMIDKARMVDISPFDETLFIDADTVVLGRLDYAFEKAAKHGVAICICECPWARRFGGLAHMGDITEFNTGIVFWSPKGNEVMTRWRDIAVNMDSSITFLSKNGVSLMPTNDQAGFALAVEQLGFNPWVLPLNFNFRPKWMYSCFGPIKIWHDYDDIPTNVFEWSRDQADPEALIGFAKLAAALPQAVAA